MEVSSADKGIKEGLKGGTYSVGVWVLAHSTRL